MLESTCIGWVVFLFDRSHHQEFYICGRGSQPKPLFFTITGEGGQPMSPRITTPRRQPSTPLSYLEGDASCGQRDFQVSMALGEMAGYWWDVCPAVNVGRANMSKWWPFFFNRTSFGSLGFSRVASSLDCFTVRVRLFTNNSKHNPEFNCVLCRQSGPKILEWMAGNNCFYGGN